MSYATNPLIIHNDYRGGDTNIAGKSISYSGGKIVYKQPLVVKTGTQSVSLYSSPSSSIQTETIRIPNPLGGFATYVVPKNAPEFSNLKSVSQSFSQPKVSIGGTSINDFLRNQSDKNYDPNRYTNGFWDPYGIIHPTTPQEQALLNQGRGIGIGPQGQLYPQGTEALFAQRAQEYAQSTVGGSSENPLSSIFDNLKTYALIALGALVVGYVVAKK